MYNLYNLKNIKKMSLFTFSLPNIIRTQLRNAQNSLRHYSLPSTQTEGELDRLYRIVELELRGNDPAVLTSCAKFATMAGNHLNIESKSWNLRKPIHERHTVLKSVHIYKKHRVQYEVRTYFTFVQFKYLTGSTADTLLEYVQRNLPEGVAMKASKVELQRLPDYISTPKAE